MESKKRAHGSVTGFFNAISWISNIGFIVAQGAAITSGVMAARALLISMICIMICQFVLLFLWLQTNQKVGRFLLSVVIILERDIFGFAVMFIIIQLVFTICFLLLSEEDDVAHRWWRAFFIWYELSVGSGGWFKDKLDDIENVIIEDGNSMDPYRKALFYLTYLIYISITLVILMNLLIAVMSETASSVTKQMKFWEQSLKLSSISLLSRRIRAASSIVRFFGFRKKCFSDKYKTYTIGGQSGGSTRILNGRLKIRQYESLRVRGSMHLFNPLADAIDGMYLCDYYSQMRYWTVLEHEALNIDKDGRKPTKQENVIEDACKVMNEKIKQFFCGFQNDNMRIMPLSTSL